MPNGKRGNGVGGEEVRFRDDRSGASAGPGLHLPRDVKQDKSQHLQRWGLDGVGRGTRLESGPLTTRDLAW